MKVFILLTFFFLTFSSCKNSKDENYKISTEFYAKDTQEEHPGKKLMEIYCYACHDATTVEEKRLAPPMIAIKRRYIFNDTSKEEFINEMQNWIKNPNEKDAKMFGAVKRFGVMLKVPYPEKDIEQIADYIFDNEIDQPKWFEAHFNQNRGKGMR